MAGPDTWRGINFQAAVAVLRALDVLDGQYGETLELELGPDIVDYSSRAASGKLVIAGQAKSRAEPYTWAPGELAELIRRWREVDGEAILEFFTDGPLSRDSVDRLVPALRAVRDGNASNADWAYLEGHGLGRDDQALIARVVLSTRQPSHGALLDDAARRMRALRDLSVPVGEDEAQDLVRELFVWLSSRGGSQDPAVRVITREEIGALVGVAPELVDSAESWSAEMAGRYRAAVAAIDVSSLLELDAALFADGWEGIDLVATSTQESGSVRERPVSELVGLDVAVTGRPGAGKSSSLELMRRAAAQAGRTPVLLRPRSYSSSSLQRLVRYEVQRVLGRVIAPGAGAALLADPATVLLLDGVGELPGETMRRALAEDLEEVRGRVSGPSVVVSGRDPGLLRPLELAVWTLRLLDRVARRELAGRLLRGDPEAAARAGMMVAEIEQALGDTVDVPLLFVLALGLRSKGHAPVGSVVALYDGYVAELLRRAGQPPDWDVELVALSGCCFDLVAEGRFSQDRWRWLTALQTELESLAARGLLARERADAAAALERLLALGIFARAEGSELALLHDSFRDWLAAQAVLRGSRELPDPLQRRWAALAGHLIESGMGGTDFLCACAHDPVTAVLAARREPPAAGDEREASAVFQQLCAHLGDELRAELEGTLLTVTGRGERLNVALCRARADGTAGEAIAGAVLPASAGPLRCATTIWLSQLRSAMQAPQAAPGAIPSTHDEAATAVAAHAERQRAYLESEARRLLPGLAADITARAGAGGLRARVHPSGGREELALSFTWGAGRTQVDVGAAELEGALSRTTVGYFLMHAPEVQAAGTLRKIIAEMLPGLGP
jgi:hypothetical protein